MNESEKTDLSKEVLNHWDVYRFLWVVSDRKTTLDNLAEKHGVYLEYIQVPKHKCTVVRVLTKDKKKYLHRIEFPFEVKDSLNLKENG